MTRLEDSGPAQGRYRLALCDVDGTLRHKDTWNPGALEMFHELHAAGVHIALCSGRTSGSLTAIVADLPEVEFVASSSGATVLRRGDDGWRVLAHRALPRAASELALDQAARAGIEVWGFTARGWYIREVSERVRNEMRYIDDEPALADLYDHADEYGKLLFLLDHDEQLTVLRDRIQWPDTEIVVSGHHYVDLVTSASHDAKGGDLIVEALGLDWRQVIAMGDSENDRGMLTRAGLAVCVPPIRVSCLGSASPGQLRFDADDTAGVCRIVGQYLGGAPAGRA